MLHPKADELLVKICKAYVRTGLTELPLSLIHILSWGNGLVSVWFVFGFSLVPVWFVLGSALVSVWFLPGSFPVSV